MEWQLGSCNRLFRMLYAVPKSNSKTSYIRCVQREEDHELHRTYSTAGMSWSNDVETTLHQRLQRLYNVVSTSFDHDVPTGVPHEDNIDAAQLRKYESNEGLVKDCENYGWQIVSYGGRL